MPIPRDHPESVQQLLACSLQIMHKLRDAHGLLQKRTVC